MDRKKLVMKANVAEQAERYDEMCACMKLVAQEKKGLTTEERNLFSVAYKNTVCARRSSWRTISSLVSNGSERSTEMMEVLTEYRTKIGKELETICVEVMDVIDEFIMPNQSDDESHLFFVKMKGDFYRYLAEITTGDRKEEVIKQSKEAYDKASKITTSLSPANPIRLGLALCQSVFNYEIANNPDIACMIAKTAFDEALSELDNLGDDAYKDSTLIMQLLRDNLTLWTSDSTTGDVDK